MRALIKVALAATLCMPRVATGQDTLEVAVAPPPGFPVEQWAVDFFNARATTRVFGPLTVARSDRYTGHVAVLDGPVVIEGEIEGTLVALNADVEIRDGAVIGGNVIVLGGALVDHRGARIDGTLRRHSARVPLRQSGNRIELRDPIPEPRGRDRGRFYRPLGRSSIIIGLGGTYNRVEGLPLRGGLRMVFGRGDVQFRLRGYGVFRTAGRLSGSREDIGYNFDAALRFGRSVPVTLEARYYDLVVPTQFWPLELYEVGWATFLWHRDYRDYFLQRGGAGRLTVKPMRDLAISGEVARVEEASIAARNPWTPFRRDDAWRLNPEIDQGDYTLVTTAITYDTRPDRRSRRSGWYARGEWQHGAGENVIEQTLPTRVRDQLPSSNYVFDRALVDLRRYQQVGSAQFRLRGMWAGTIGRDPLPVQRRFSLGGPDPLNGYRFRAFACNDAAVDSALTGLCDNVLLLQAEYRGGLSFDWFDDDDDDFRRASRHQWSEDRHWVENTWFSWPTLVLFSNAGTGWIKGQPIGKLNFDVGAGIEAGSFGVYFAKAIADEPLLVTLRVKRRF